MEIVKAKQTVGVLGVHCFAAAQRMVNRWLFSPRGILVLGGQPRPGLSLKTLFCVNKGDRDEGFFLCPLPSETLPPTCPMTLLLFFFLASLLLAENIKNAYHLKLRKIE